MKTWWLLTIGLAGIGCATPRAVAPAAIGPAPGWVAASARSEAAVDTNRASEEPRVIVQATSPTEIHYRTEGETVVPLQHRHPPAPSIRRVRTHQGMWIGAGLGVLSALTMSRPPNDEAHGCDVYCGSGAGLAAVGLGAIGLGLGAAVGAIVGSLEMP